MQHLEAVPLDFIEQRAVDAGHHEARLLRSAIFLRQQRDCFVVILARALRLEPHQRGEAIRILAIKDLTGLHIKLLQLVDRQVDATAQNNHTDNTKEKRKQKGKTEQKHKKRGLG